MMAPDFGCTFPLCDATALHTEAHHIREWRDGGETSVDNGTLLCGNHHDHFHAMGWTCVQIDGVPHWLAPTWIDPNQKPTRKTDHDL
jgi:hypothetical protein